MNELLLILDTECNSLAKGLNTTRNHEFYNLTPNSVCGSPFGLDSIDLPLILACNLLQNYLFS